MHKQLIMLDVLHRHICSVYKMLKHDTHCSHQCQITGYRISWSQQKKAPALHHIKAFLHDKELLFFPKRCGKCYHRFRYSTNKNISKMKLLFLAVWQWVYPLQVIQLFRKGKRTQVHYMKYLFGYTQYLFCTWYTTAVSELMRALWGTLVTIQRLYSPCHLHNLILNQKNINTGALVNAFWRPLGVASSPFSLRPGLSYWFRWFSKANQDFWLARLSSQPTVDNFLKVT